MISKNQPAPQRQKVLTFVSPKVADILFYETIDAQRVGSVLPEYGTPHPDTAKWPNHKLVHAAPDEGSQFYRYYYAADREAQDDYNYVLEDGQRVTRTYVIPREDYPAELEPPVGGFPDVLFPPYGFTGDTIRDLGSPLNSIFISVERTYDRITRVSYPYDPALEKNITITRTIKPVDYVLGDDSLVSQDGTIYEIQEGNAFHSVLMTTEAGVDMGENGYAMISSVYSSVANYNFPVRLDSFAVQTITAWALCGEGTSFDYAQDMMADTATTDPINGPFKIRKDRYIATDTEAVIDLLSTEARIPHARTDETVISGYIYEECADDGTKALAKAFFREFQVPTALHVADIIAAMPDGVYSYNSVSGSYGFTGDLVGDYLIDISTRDSTAGTYEVEATFLVLDGVYGYAD